MRVFSYNILDGGEGRADPLAEVILAQRADIVAIVEADNADVLNRLSARLGMDYVHADGRKSSAALFSRWPVRDSMNNFALNKRIRKVFLQATVIDPAGNEWPIGVIHLPAHAREKDETKREESLSLILDATRCLRKASQRHLICGDFNSNSPVQKIEVKQCKKSTREEYAENGNRIPRRVVKKILDAGYVDTLHAFDPIAGETAGTFSTQYPGQRVDYIFAYGFDKSAIQSAWIETDRLAKFASDHFPIGVEIQI